MTNTWIGVGNLTRDPDTRYASDTQKAVTRFTVAVSRLKEGTDYISCIAFGKTAEVISQYCHKGSKVAVTGGIRTGSYEKDGRTIYTTDVVVERIDFLDPKNKSAAPAEPVQSEVTFENIDEDVPF